VHHSWVNLGKDMPVQTHLPLAPADQHRSITADQVRTSPRPEGRGGWQLHHPERSTGNNAYGMNHGAAFRKYAKGMMGGGIAYSPVRAWLAAALLAFSGLVLAQSGGMTSEQAFQAGQAFGSSANSGIAPNINSGKAAEVLKDYTPTAPESSYWQGNNTLLSNVLSGGSDKIYDCDANVGSMTDPKQKNPCEAINMLNKLPAVMPPPMVTKTDPLYTTGRAIADNPEAIAGAIKGAYSGCTTKTTTIQGETVNQTCDEYLGIDNVKCQIGQVVEVDADHLYKCLETLKALSDQTCTIGRVVELNPEYNYQCIQNQYQTKTMKCEKVLKVDVTSEKGCFLADYPSGIQIGVYGDWPFPGIVWGAPAGSGVYNLRWGTGGIICKNNVISIDISGYYDQGDWFAPVSAKIPFATDIPRTLVGGVGAGGPDWVAFYFSMSCPNDQCTATFSMQYCDTAECPEISSTNTADWPPSVFPVPVDSAAFKAVDVWDNQCTALEARAQ